jgi:hypothetical protein
MDSILPFLGAILSRLHRLSRVEYLALRRGIKIGMGSDTTQQAVQGVLLSRESRSASALRAKQMRGLLPQPGGFEA